jgi:hypothetical protein
MVTTVVQNRFILTLIMLFLRFSNSFNFANRTASSLVTYVSDGFSSEALTQLNTAEKFDLVQTLFWRKSHIKAVVHRGYATGKETVAPEYPEAHTVYLREDVPDQVFIEVPMPEIPNGPVGSLNGSN